MCFFVIEVKSITSVSMFGVFRVKYPSRSTNWAAFRPYCGRVGQRPHIIDTSEACSDCEELLKHTKVINFSWQQNKSYKPKKKFTKLHLLVYGKEQPVCLPTNRGRISLQKECFHKHFEFVLVDLFQYLLDERANFLLLELGTVGSVTIVFGTAFTLGPISSSLL